MNLAALAKTAVKNGAPLIGAVLGTPAGVAIGQLVAKAFGSDESDYSTTDLINKINLDPDAKIKLAEIESNYKIELEKIILQNTFNQMKSANENTANARENNNKHVENIYFSMFISFLVIASFYVCIYWIAIYPQDAGDHDVLYMLFGIAGTAFGAVINYWLGSSAEKGYKPK